MSGGGPSLIIRGHTISFRADPFTVEPEAAIETHADGAVVVRNGLIGEVGPGPAVVARHPGATVEHYPGHVIMAGFVDAHAHYPQTGIIAAYGAQLIEWLQRYTFPAELAFADQAHAERVAETYLDECLRNGITTACSYCTAHPHSVDVLLTAAERRGLRMAAGKVMMDRNAPQGLLDTAGQSYDDSKALIARWHGRGRMTYAISPRFAITSTPAQLEAAGALWREHPTALLQTHLSENGREIAWVRELFPEAQDYLAVYERYGLVAPGANLGHAIHLSERERRAIAERGAGISHCPTSNLFIGSGLFDLKGLGAGERPVAVGLATDVGGGSSFSMLATMRAAYEIAQLQGFSLHPLRAYHLATVGGARVLKMADRIGNLRPGLEADILVLDLMSQPVIRQRMMGVDTIADALFVQMILGDDRAVRAVYAGGRKIHDRDVPAALPWRAEAGTEGRT
jgi:guanine deaminase